MSDNPSSAPMESGNAPNSQNSSPIPVWFWVVSFLALIWNLMGLVAFAAQMMMTEEMMAALPPEQQELYKTIPVWATAAFAIAVFAGVLGSVGLLMRAKWAFPVFIMSLLGVLVQQSHMYIFSDTMKVMGTAAMIMPTVVLILAFLLVAFSKSSVSKGWLK